MLKKAYRGLLCLHFILGLALGILTRPDSVYESFYDPLFCGLLSILMLIIGMVAHYITGFSLGGVVILAVIACSSSDISGPPTLRVGIPSANPSAYIGASTAIGTPVAIGLGIPLYIGFAQTLMGS